MIDVKELKDLLHIGEFGRHTDTVSELLDALEASNQAIALLGIQNDELAAIGTILNRTLLKQQTALEAADGLLYEVDKHKRGSLMFFKARDKYRDARGK